MTGALRHRTFLFMFASLCGLSSSYGEGAGASAGTLLLEAPGARISALGEAGSALTNDITAFALNPAALNTLSSHQLAFLYHKGIFDDVHGDFTLGGPVAASAVGLGVSYYDAGDADLFENGAKRTVNAQQDLKIAIAYAREFGSLEAGLAMKYISSELAESDHASAFAGDLGIGIQAHSRLRLALAAQNFGGDLTYVSVGQKLPRMVRLGLSADLLQGKRAVMLLLDAPYLLNERTIETAMGLETRMGPLSLRAGYQDASDLGGVSLGAGLRVGRFSIDYSIGLFDNVDSRHRIGLSVRGGDK